MNSDKSSLRHALATLAYRSSRTLQSAPDTFAAFRIGPESRMPVEILTHIGDLMEWALSLAKGAQKWNEATPLEWNKEVARFYETLKAFDDYLSSDEPLKCEAERLFQGPVADALTHIGQISMIRRLAGSPVKGENFFVADIVAGKVGMEQGVPKRAF